MTKQEEEKIVAMLRSSDTEMIELGIRILFGLDTSDRLDFVYTHFTVRSMSFNALPLDAEIQLHKRFVKDGFCMFIWGDKLYHTSVHTVTHMRQSYCTVKL